MSSHDCDYCLKKFSRADSRKRHEKTCKIKEYLTEINPRGRQTEPSSPLLGPDVTSPRPTEPPSQTDTETTEFTEPNESTETVQIDPNSGEIIMYDAFGDPMTPEEIANDFPEVKSPRSPIKTVSDMDPWDVFRDRVKTEKLKDFKVVMKTLRKEGLGKKLAQIRAYNEMLPELRKALRQVYIEHLKWVHVLREDPIHKAILETRKKFQEEEDMDFNEAVEAAVNQRKYLLNRVFQPMEEPDTDDEDMDEDDEENHEDDTDEEDDMDDEDTDEEDESPDESPDQDSPEEGDERPRYDPFGIPPSFTQPL